MRLILIICLIMLSLAAKPNCKPPHFRRIHGTDSGAAIEPFSESSAWKVVGTGWQPLNGKLAEEGPIYRFLPKKPGQLAAGGRLQALAIDGKPGFDARNWNGKVVVETAKALAQWLDITSADTQKNDLRKSGRATGAAVCARVEGIWSGNGAIYGACKNGDQAKKGQIWKYTASASEGTSGEAQRPGVLELFIEPNNPALVDPCDNIPVRPNSGDLFVCEDNDDRRDTNNIVGVVPSGDAFIFAHNSHNNSEFAGACFSAEGSTLFVNIYEPGLTLAITGPFHRG